jgi:hypothetical protein
MREPMLQRQAPLLHVRRLKALFDRRIVESDRLGIHNADIRRRLKVLVMESGGVEAERHAVFAAGFDLLRDNVFRIGSIGDL